MFPPLPLENFPLVISSLGLTHSALEVTQGIQALITSCFTSFPTSPIPYCYYFGKDLCLSFRGGGGNLPCVEGIKCDNTALTFQVPRRILRKKSFFTVILMQKSQYMVTYFLMAHTGNSLSFSLFHAHAQTHTRMHTRMVKGSVLSLPE